jgi:hypothetical protein
MISFVRKTVECMLFCFEQMEPQLHSSPLSLVSKITPWFSITLCTEKLVQNNLWPVTEDHGCLRLASIQR